MKSHNGLVPAMEVKATPGVPPLYELEGWDDLNRWGMLNHGQWFAIQRRLEWADGMSETDKLRLLAGEMLRLNVDLMEKYLETARLIPPPNFILFGDQIPLDDSGPAPSPRRPPTPMLTTGQTHGNPTAPSHG
jgi:hypothetical protein